MATGKKKKNSKKKKQNSFLNRLMRAYHTLHFAIYNPFGWSTLPLQIETPVCVNSMKTWLRQLKLIETSNLQSLTEMLCCNPSTKQCMYGECDNCAYLQLIQQGRKGDFHSVDT